MKNIFALVCLLGLFCACTNNQSSDLQIKSGIAHVSGKVTGTLPFEINEKTSKIKLVFTNPLIQFQIEQATYLQADGTFILDVPVACASFGQMYSEFYEGGIYLVPNEETKLDIAFDETGEKHINMVNSSGLTTEEIINLGTTLMEVYWALPDGNPNIVSPEEFSKEIINRTKLMQQEVDKHTEVSEANRQWIANTLKLMFLDFYLFDYEKSMLLRYHNATKEKDRKDFTPITPEKSYYEALKYFDLNNSGYLLCEYYFVVLQDILDNKTLNIPPIGDMPINDWLKEVKAIIADYIGADTGLFYDMLASNAYAKQFEEMKPLSDKQKENIKKYYKNKSFVDVLFAKNEKIAKFAANFHQPIVNETPAVPQEFKIRGNGKLVDAIVSKYKGKVVVVDFWATWCAPCLQAMRTSQELKDEMMKEGVVFVYIASNSSPPELWKKKIQGIGGEQYYLNEEEWESISYSDKYGFDGIPTYLLFDTNGIFKHKMTSYPGNDEMLKMIEELL